MNSESSLIGKSVLAVDDEPDILEIIRELLNGCIVHTASDYDTALQYLQSYTYDVVILDIMGVDGFALLKISVSRGCPTLMLTAHALTPEALKKSITLGAVFFLPKERISELSSYLEEIVSGGGKPIWQRLFERLEGYFSKKFGPDWKEKDQFFKDFEREVLKGANRLSGPKT